MRLPQTSRFGLRGVRSTLVDERVEPDDVGGGLGRERRARRKRERAGQIVDAEIEAGAPLQQFLNLRVRLGRAERRRELDLDQIGHVQAELAAQLAGDRLRDQRFRPLPRAVKFDHVHAVVVRFDDRRQ